MGDPLEEKFLQNTIFYLNEKIFWFFRKYESQETNGLQDSCAQTIRMSITKCIVHWLKRGDQIGAESPSDFNPYFNWVFFTEIEETI